MINMLYNVINPISDFALGGHTDLYHLLQSLLTHSDPLLQARLEINQVTVSFVDALSEKNEINLVIYDHGQTTENTKLVMERLRSFPSLYRQLNRLASIDVNEGMGEYYFTLNPHDRWMSKQGQVADSNRRKQNVN